MRAGSSPKRAGGPRSRRANRPGSNARGRMRSSTEWIRQRRRASGSACLRSRAAESMDRIERFFLDRGAAAMHEVSPLAGVATIDLLVRPGIQAVRDQQRAVSAGRRSANGTSGTDPVRPRDWGGKTALWTKINARAGPRSSGISELSRSTSESLVAAREDSVCFLAELDGQPGCAGVLCLHEDVALFGGASTVPEMRRRGLQSALLQARKQYASNTGATC